MEKRSKIFVAGHNGMVGSALVRALEADGYGNIVARTRSELDLTRMDRVEKFFDEQRPEYVFLAAAKVGGILANSTRPAEFIHDNLRIQNNVIHCAHEFGAKKLLFLGSSCIYPRNCPQPMKEEYLLSGPLEKTNEAYAVAKIAGIKMCQFYHSQYGDDFVSVMPTNLYGINDNFDLDTSHVLPAMIVKFHAAKQKLSLVSGRREDGERVAIWGTGKPMREFLHVDDMAQACVFVMNHVSSQTLYAEGLTHLNVGAGKDISISDLANLIKEIVGYGGEIAYDSAMPDGTPRKLLDVSRLAELGWSPKIPLRKGIEDTYRWYRKNVAGRGATN